MLLQRLTVVPTDDSLRYLNNVFSTAPFDIDDFSELSVDIMLSTDPIVANPLNTYTLVPKHIKIFYDSNLGASSWIMSFESHDLQRRYRQLEDLGVQPAFYEFYHPHAVIMRYAPPLSSNYRRFIVSMANVFGDSNKPLVFGNEITTDVDLHAPPEFDYNVEMDKEVSGRSYMTGF